MDRPVWSLPLPDLAQILGSNIDLGLTKSKAALHLKQQGSNALPQKKGTCGWKIFFRQFSSWIIWLLLVATVIAFFLGEELDAIAISSIVVLNAVLGFFQEFRAEKAILALQKLSPSYSKVIRDGVLTSIRSEEIVCGDLIEVEAGDRIGADGRLVQNYVLAVDESSLTGESKPTHKDLEQLDLPNLPIGDRSNMVFMGTKVTKGKGRFLVTQTGAQSEVGKIASSLIEAEKPKTPLQNKLDLLGKKLVVLCLLIVLIVFGLGLFQGSTWIDMLLVSLSLAVAAIPEGLPAAVTISLSIGVRKMAAKNALVRRLSSVETLGCTDCICADKTGTLTKNQMTAVAVWVDGQQIIISGSGYEPKGEFSKETPSLQTALLIGALCNGASLHQREGVWEVTGDPMEGALLSAAIKGGIDPKQAQNKQTKIQEIPFDSKQKRMGVVYEDEHGQTLYIKGALSTILERCNTILIDGKQRPITKEDQEAIFQVEQDFANKTLRILAVSYQSDLTKPLEEALTFVGLFAFEDPIRPEVKGAIEECARAGIRTIMVTGDYQQTAIAIANKIGLSTDHPIDGAQMQDCSDEQIIQSALFSRISPSDKLRIVTALKANGSIVAMTGDGVNDAPAIEAADIGVSMGISGTDVAKESSDMVILDDNFASIVEAVRWGRGIYDNIVKFVSYLLSSNLAEIFVIFLPILFGWKGDNGAFFLPLLPIQLLWMNLVTDGLPAICLALDPIDPTVMDRPPRKADEPILNRRFSLLILLMSGLITIGALAACLWGLQTSSSLAQTMTFTTLIVLELVRVQMIREEYQLSITSNPMLLWALVSSFVLQLGVVYIPSLQPIFGTVPLGWKDWAVIGVIASLLFLGGRMLSKMKSSR